MSNSSSYECDLENSFVLNANLDALQKSASNIFQVQCTSIQEFKEGGFHKVYILKMEDGKEYIGRLAISIYSQWKTESEAAVMEYIRLNTHISVPKFIIGIVLLIIRIFFTGEQATLPTMECGPFKTTKEYILAVIRNQMHYYSMFKSTNKQKCLIPKYEELYQLVPKYFQDDRNNMFVLTHIDFHTSNILVKNDEITGIIDWECSGAFLVECLCTYPVWITNNPMIEQTNKKSRKNIKLQKFFRDEMSRHDPDLIRTMDNIDEEKKEFYSTVFSQEIWKIDDFLNKFRIK
ncbi:kinase-like protein [Gigaspora margarita]|uniref:Kinase-like protein n=1 Tax=Gigaspora margarita TaxID=4874 RepID=A0A8H4A1Q8_GIGMA|nr:kinase-like protein [Gigaspora margarita]